MLNGNLFFKGILSMKLSLFIMSFLVFLCAGCANLSTIGRTTSLNEAKAIHLDAAQRLVFSGKDGDICAEPSPDALQAYAASVGFGFTNKQLDASLAQAFGAGSTNIGLRTQSITLMRDHLYRICEASHNNKLNHGDVLQLLERSQDLTLGILAIEQLTGAVVQGQKQLNATSDSTVDDKPAKPNAALDKAIVDEASAKKALDDANVDYQKKNDLLVATQKDIVVETAKPTPDQAKIDTLKAQLTKQKTDSGESYLTKDDAQKGYDKVQKTTEDIKKKLPPNGKTVTTSDDVNVTEKSSTQQRELNPSIVTSVAQATYNIVNAVINKGHLTDACIGIITKYGNEVVQLSKARAEVENVQQLESGNEIDSKLKSGYKSKLNENQKIIKDLKDEIVSSQILIDTCKEVIKADLIVYQKTVGAINPGDKASGPEYKPADNPKGGTVGE